MKNFLKTVDADWFRLRVTGAMIFVLMAFIVLFARLFYLQVIEGKAFRRLSESNSIRLQSIDPPRGLILDRKGELIVDNRPSFDLSIIPRDTKPLDETVEKLYRYIQLPKDEILGRIKQGRGILSYKPVSLRQDIGRDVLAAIEAHKFDLPGVTVKVKPIRHYLGNYTAAHLIGYLSEINTDELKSRKYADYRAGDYIGKFGVEKAYETFLRGERGGRQVEVNAVGQVVSILKTVPAKPGYNLNLTTDRRLQEKAEDLMAGKAGAVIAMVPDNGHILALVSSPSFDQNAFVSGLSHAQWSSLTTNPSKPMLNKAVQGEYPPASVFKIVTAIAGLEEGVIDEETTFHCPGFYRLGDRDFRCWKEGGHGTVDVIQALAESCDVFFYQVGEAVGIEKLAVHARASGFGALTGINLDGESEGLVPGRDWKKQYTGIGWVGGDTLSVAIGQGYNLATPIQILVMTAAVANGGERYRPMILDSIVSADGEVIKRNSPRVIGRLSAGEETLAIVRKGLWQVVNTQSGTAWGARIRGIEMAGKTGTAQVVSRSEDEEAPADEEEDVAEHLRDHAWFAAYAPANAPKIAVVVIVEHGEHGSTTAAPIASELVEAYLAPDNE